MFLWQLMAWMVMRHPCKSSNCSSSGIDVTSLEWAAVRGCPGIIRFSVAQALTRCRAARLWQPRSVLPSMATTSPGTSWLTEFTRWVKQAANRSGSSLPNTRPKVSFSCALIKMRLPCAVIANALVCHERIAGMQDGIKPLNLAYGPRVPDPQRGTLDAWTKILSINYWPIFAVGRDILGQLPAAYANRILGSLHYTAAQVTTTGVNHAHDLAGRVFQRLISDRKYPATFYILPVSAALLARLAVAKMKRVDWSGAEAIGKLRVGDFASGALL